MSNVMGRTLPNVCKYSSSFSGSTSSTTTITCTTTELEGNSISDNVSDACNHIAQRAPERYLVRLTIPHEELMEPTACKKQKRQVHWAPDAVDNELLNKKKSKSTFFSL